MAARASADFIESVGFDKRDAPESENSFGRLRTVSFNYTKQDVNGRDVEALVELPLLSLVPIPLLQVKDAQLSFSLKIIETNSQTTEPLRSVASSAFSTTATSSPPVSMQAVYKASNNTDTTIDMKVTINLVQSDMPAGLQQLFQIMEQASTSKQTQTDPTPVSSIDSRAMLTAAQDTATAGPLQS